MSYRDDQDDRIAMHALKDHLNGMLQKSGKCLLWTGYVGKDGYGRIYHNFYPSDLGKSLVHRLMYLFEFGGIENRMIVKQTCGNKLCCEPKHLKLVDRSEISANAKKTHCIRGHKLPVVPVQYGERLERTCPECNRIRQAEYRARKSMQVEKV